jgi:hypothetical protein
VIVLKDVELIIKGKEGKMCNYHFGSNKKGEKKEL